MKLFRSVSYIILGEYMKIESLGNDHYNIYIFFDYQNNKDNIKSIIDRIRKILKINGFYKAIICVKNIGFFIELIKIEDSYYKESFDCKIIFQDKDIYFKTKDYFVIANLNTIKYCDGYYYGLVDDSFDKLIEKVEFGDFVFENNDIIRNSCLV